MHPHRFRRRGPDENAWGRECSFRRDDPPHRNAAKTAPHRRTQRGLGRLKIHQTGRTQEAVHGLSEGQRDGCTQFFIRLRVRTHKGPAVQAPAGKNGFCKGFEDPEQGSFLHFSNHGFGKTGTGDFGSAGNLAGQVVGDDTGLNGGLKGGSNPGSRFFPCHVLQHHGGGQNQGAGVDLVQPRIFRGRAVRGFKYRAICRRYWRRAPCQGPLSGRPGHRKGNPRSGWGWR